MNTKAFSLVRGGSNLILGTGSEKTKIFFLGIPGTVKFIHQIVEK